MLRPTARLRRAPPVLMVVLVELCALPASAQAPTTPDLQNTKWQLVRFEGHGETLWPDASATFALEFGAVVTAKIDCATGVATWNAKGGDLHVGKLEVASKRCAPGSMADRLIDDWGDIRSYSVRDGSLYLALKNGRGWYVFDPAPKTGNLAEAIKRLEPYRQDDKAPIADSTFIKFDAKGVDFNPWLRRFIAQVRSNWYVPQKSMSLHGHAVVAFDVHKDGRLTDVHVETASSVEAFNEAARNALVLSNPTEPLPAAYPAEHAHFTVNFFYNERVPIEQNTPFPK